MIELLRQELNLYGAGIAMKCDHCDNEATHQTVIWFLCPDCLEEWKEGQKAELQAVRASPYSPYCNECGEELKELLDGGWECPYCDAPEEPERE